MVLTAFYISHDWKILLKTGKNHDLKTFSLHDILLYITAKYGIYNKFNGYFLSVDFMLLSDRKNPLHMKWANA